jgi:hypothetical protein
LKHTFKVCGGGSEREGFFLRVENDFYNWSFLALGTNQVLCIVFDC